MSSLAKIRSYLKLYTAISVAKLARFNAISDDDFRSELLAIKHIMSQSESEPGMAALDGKIASALDIHFFVKVGRVQCGATIITVTSPANTVTTITATALRVTHRQW